MSSHDWVLRKAIDAAYLADESACVEALLAAYPIAAAMRARAQSRARELVETVRQKSLREQGLNAFLHEYDLSSQEGIVIMCLAEALLRIPDTLTAEKLIHDKLTQGEWDKHLGHSHSLLVNASTWGLLLTGRFVELDQQWSEANWLKRFVAHTGEGVVRAALAQAMRIMGQQFVMGTTIEDAYARSQQRSHSLYRYSFDMLGEAALSAQDADRYYQAYSHAIAQLGMMSGDDQDYNSRPSISIKLSALHPRYEWAQRERVMNELVPRLLALVEQARSVNIAVTIDAEESERLALSLDIFSSVWHVPSLSGWSGMGIAVQAYQKRAPYVIDWLINLARNGGRRVPVRLVKGAYWDSEIKRSQERGLSAYPVYTRKISTDVAYLVCAKRLLDAGASIFPQFATHNAYTLSCILELAGERDGFEFQRLHGMGEELYEQIVGPQRLNKACRVYAPVGSYKDLLPYLVRRLLENGANTSFINRLVNETVSLDDIIADPFVELQKCQPKPHPHIPLPRNLFGEARLNSLAISLHDTDALAGLQQAIALAMPQPYRAAPIVNGVEVSGEEHSVIDPADQRRIVGRVAYANESVVDQALHCAAQGAKEWSALPVNERASALERTAELIEQQRATLMALCIREGGKTFLDAQAEVREAADFCRYYAHIARHDFSTPTTLRGPTGESNQLSWHARGVFACISPWNFPLAIFTGQVSAALAAGNAVIAKPATQTPLVAAQLVQLMLQAGVPGNVLQFLPGRGALLGAHLARDARVAGFAFTGSTDTAKQINQWLAARDGAIVPFIAETGGQNAMIVDSSALPEQVVNDVMASAFNSAGQRCSALRVLFVQQDIAARVIELLKGAMAELHIGDPALLATDVGPVIDNAARTTLLHHTEHLRQIGQLVYTVTLPVATEHGSFVAPSAWIIDNLSLLTREVFGPVLHIITYSASHLDAVIEAINDTGYGLTLGIHSRIDATITHIRQRARVGNLYVNRNMIGAVVGVQPFGGEGLSGTGPKAGGPHYLQRFATERTVSINTAAVGGNASLLSLS